jgi:hypothetical protein
MAEPPKQTEHSGLPSAEMWSRYEGFLVDTHVTECLLHQSYGWNPLGHMSRSTGTRVLPISGTGTLSIPA